MQKLNKAEAKTLKLRIATYRAALPNCTTVAMRNCVLEQIECASLVLRRGHW